MSARTVSVSVPLPTRRGIGVAIASALVGAAVAIAAVFALNGDDSPRGGSAGAAKAQVVRGPGFALAAPAGWRAVPAARLAALPSHPVAMLERRDGRGTVIVRRKQPPKNQTLRALTTGLTASLGQRFADFRFVSARVQRLRGGPAYLYTFVRTNQKTAQSIALVKVGRASYTLDSVAAAGDRRAATEVAAVVRSFGP